jgi:hypothetical protein
VGTAITDLRPTSINAAVLKADRADWNASGKYLMVSGRDLCCVCEVK